MESLRRRLRRGGVGEVTCEANTPDAEPVPTEIALSVAERCGKCGGPFTTLFLDGMIVDRCSSCRGVWLDYGELDRILDFRSEAPTMMPGQEFKEAPLDRLVGSCPTCRVGLEAYRVPGQPAHLEICAHCLGAWFDNEELQLLAHDDVVQWLRNLLQSMEHRSESLGRAPSRPRK